MNEEPVVLRYFDQEENLPFGLIVVEKMGKIRE